MRAIAWSSELRNVYVSLPQFWPLEACCTPGFMGSIHHPSAFWNIECVSKASFHSQSMPSGWWSALRKANFMIWPCIQTLGSWICSEGIDCKFFESIQRVRIWNTARKTFLLHLTRMRAGSWTYMLSFILEFGATRDNEASWALLLYCEKLRTHFSWSLESETAKGFEYSLRIVALWIFFPSINI